LIRTRQDHVSLEEVRRALDDILRYRIGPLIITSRTTGVIRDPVNAARMIQAQLVFDQQALDAAKRQEAAHREALAAYEEDAANRATLAAAQKTMTSGPGVVRTPSAETVMPPMSETFVDRLVDLT